MIGAIAGDIIGSVFERHPIKTTDFPLFCNESTFTDDTILTVALADSILNRENPVDAFRRYYNLYPDAGYGPAFIRWASSASRFPYNSWGNGSAMRVSPVAFAYDSFDEVLQQAKSSAEVTHNHPEGIKGAQATAAAIFLARSGCDKKEIASVIASRFGYRLDEPLASIRTSYQFDASCQGSVPQSILAFLEANSYEEAVRNAVSLGGDSDTMACIAGGIAQAYYKTIPEPILQRVATILDPRLTKVVREFLRKYDREFSFPPKG